MPGFVYTGRDNLGTLVRGVLDADDEERARKRLREQGLFITSLRTKGRGSTVARFRPAVGTEELAAFTFHLAGLTASGVPLLRGLDLLSEQTESRAMRTAVTDLNRSIQAGHSLSAALGRHPNVFSALYIGVVRAGEVSGTLDQALLRLAGYLDRELELQQKVRAMMVYPVFVLVVAAAVAGLFMAFVVPVFERVYRSAGASLPLPTLALLFTSQVARRYWPLLLAAVLAAVWTVRRRGVLWEWVRAIVEHLLYRTPRLGAVMRTIQVSRFIRTLGAMQASGVPVLTAMEVAMETTVDPVMRSAIARLEDGINRGRRISDVMRSEPLFPAMIHRIVAMGDELGQLDAMLQRASDLLDRETDYAIKRLVTLAEPMLTLALGAVVGAILLALYLPIFGLPRVLLR